MSLFHMQVQSWHTLYQMYYVAYSIDNQYLRITPFTIAATRNSYSG